MGPDLHMHQAKPLGPLAPVTVEYPSLAQEWGRPATAEWLVVSVSVCITGAPWPSGGPLWSKYSNVF
jgi:hypothetical protein